MTIGNMRANGVQTLVAWCLGRDCNHFRLLDVSGYADDVPVPSTICDLTPMAQSDPDNPSFLS
jgi:hypothetical protein